MNHNNTHTIDAVKDADALCDILSTGVIFPLLVTGSSMMPFLKNGRDTVRLQKTDRLYRGQIIFFQRHRGAFTLHRIRKIYPDGRLLVNGDAQNWCEIVRPEQVLAAVVSVNRNGRDIRQNSAPDKIVRALWYPTRPIRPFLWKCLAFLQRLTKKQRKTE